MFSSQNKGYILPTCLWCKKVEIATVIMYPKRFCIESKKFLAETGLFKQMMKSPSKIID